MDLQSPTGQRFRLTIEGYEFPRAWKEWHTRNWLNVRIQVLHPRGHWEKTDPALLTEEVEELASWLERVARGDEVGNRTFIEPKLAFACTVDGAGRRVVRVYIEQRFRPMWAESHDVGRRDLWVDFPVDPEQLLSAAAELRRQLERYPERPSGRFFPGSPV